MKNKHVYFLFAFNKNVDIKFTMHDAFMENPYSETLKAQNIEKPNDIKVFGSTNTKKPKQDSQNQLISPMSE